MLVISETSTSNHFYHLRKVGSAGVKQSGGLSLLGEEGHALCGNDNLGWDTALPLSSYGMKDSFSHWCPKCQEIWDKLEIK